MIRNLWTAVEDDLILNVYPTMRAVEFKTTLMPNRTLGAIQQRAHNLSAQKHKPAYYCPDKLWTESELQGIRDNYATMPTRKVRDTFCPDRTIGAVMRKAKLLGLRQLREFHDTRGQTESTEDMFQYCSDIDKAYIAGIFDGEGSIGFYAKATIVTITNCEPRLIDFLVKKFGHIHYCGQDRSPTYGNYRCFRWTINGHRRAQNFVRGILPYLIVKREQAELLLGPYPETVAERKDLAQKIKLAKTSGLTKVNPPYDPTQT
jgi:hypothetical protein